MAKGLGRGLNAFFTDENDDSIEEVTSKDKVLEKVVELRISDIEPMLNQPRKTFNEKKLKELATSIEANGVLQPILVVKDKHGYTIVAGERRWRAAKMAGLTKIPAIIKDYTDSKKKQVSLVENIQREDLNVIEIAHAIRDIIDIEGYTNEEVARLTGKNSSTIANTLRLLKLPNEIQEMVLRGELVEGQARAILAIPDEEKQIEVAKKAAEKKMTVRDVEKIVYGDEEYQRSREKKTPKTVYYHELEGKLKDYFGFKVKLDSTHRHQRLIIEYNDDEGLESIFAKLNIKL